MKLQLKASRVYRENHQSKARITLNIGGSRSTKTYSIAQLFLTKAFEETGQVFTVARKTLPALKATAYRDFLDILKENNLYSPANHNKSELTYHLNGNEIEFISVDQPQKIRGRKRKYLWMNEANEFEYDDYAQLILRTTGQVFMDMNPSDYDHWIRDQVESRTDVKIIHSTYLDNPFLEPEVVNEIERLQEADPNYWKIYGLGQYGVPQTLVYGHWRFCDALPEGGEEIGGLDFGWNNPCVLTKVVIKDNAIYAQELIYQSRLKDNELADLMDEMGVSKQMPIYADSEDPQAIQTLRDRGYNVIEADKGQGSVLAGIREIQKRPFYITKGSINMHKEIKAYSWKVKNGKPIDEPVKLNDHSMDSVRYPVYTHLRQSFVGFV